MQQVQQMPGIPGQEQQPSVVPAEAFGTLRNMHQLSLEAFLSKSKQELIFRILNRSIVVAQYGRIALFNLADRKMKFLGISGKSDINEKSPLVDSYRDIVKKFRDSNEPKVITERDFEDSHQIWDNLRQKEERTKSFLWLPINVNEKPAAGLLLERWDTHPEWDEKEVKMLSALSLSYSAAWEKIFQQQSLMESIFKLFTKTRMLLAIAVVIAAMFAIKVQLRIVAPCEVIPENPRVVAAPLDGVVAKIKVDPGQQVKKGEILFEYDKSVIVEELNVVKQQVKITRQDLKRAKVQAFNDPKARSTILLLENKLKQDEIKLKLAQLKAEKVQVNGVVMISTPHEWQGRPVVVGEKVLTIVNKTKLAVWLPENDNIPFDEGKAINVFLNIAPDETKKAKLNYVAKHITKTPEGVPSFLAEADWEDKDKDLRIGLEGTAMLYGDKVSVAYWLARKPWATVRQQLGM
ncbi:MAG: HlyD family efflux transporter periplasmic adaptor subunit [Planctomycetota bacterium]|jgi:GAF domain-containing protein